MSDAGPGTVPPDVMRDNQVGRDGTMIGYVYPTPQAGVVTLHGIIKKGIFCSYTENPSHATGYEHMMPKNILHLCGVICVYCVDPTAADITGVVVQYSE